MPSTDLLLYLQETDLHSPGPRAAAALAARLGARLDGLYVADLPAAAFSLPEAVPVQLEETRRRCVEAEEHGAEWQRLLASRGYKVGIVSQPRSTATPLHRQSLGLKQ